MRVSLVTEGTYPYIMGGVSSWCHDLVHGLDDVNWHVVPITAGGFRRTARFELPPNVTMEPGIELWSRPVGGRGLRRSADDAQRLLPAQLCHQLLGTPDDHDDLLDLLATCRESPKWARQAFRSKDAWSNFLDELHTVTRSVGTDLFADVKYTALEATELWQTLYWLAVTAATPLPETDVLLITAAGWGAVMAAAEKKHRGTPVVLTEHGLYVREAYLEAARTATSAGRQFTRTRLARGLSRLSYAIADKVTPVSDSHHQWENTLGAPTSRLHTISNGVPTPYEPPAASSGMTICSVGRVDPLKDVVTMLRTAATVLETHPDARFVHWGPVASENLTYYDMCLRVHEELGLVDGFVFMGSTDQPRRAMREADIYLSTSISEGLPLSVLEAMTEARPIVATNVGGCEEAVNGCGVLANAGDHFGLAHGVTFLLDNPDFATLMGRRGFRRARRHFSSAAQLDQYRDLLEGVAG